MIELATTLQQIENVGKNKMTSDTRLIEARRQGWNDARKYVKILERIKETGDNYYIYGLKKTVAIVDELDVEIKRMEEIYGELFVAEYKDERKEITLLEDGD